MSEHKHDHDHEHDASCCGHDHSASAVEHIDPPETDLAAKSLSDALRLSFRILAWVMGFVLVGFLCSGISCAGSDKVAVIKVFGKVVGHSDRRGGLTFSWPYPIGEVRKVRVNNWTVPIKDFWMMETPADIGNLNDLAARAATASTSLRPGLDGALITGDQNLVHVLIDCSCQIENPDAYLQRFEGRDDNEPDPALVEMVRSAVCNAAIHVAATQTADSIIKQQGGAFQAGLSQACQEELDRLLPVVGTEARVVRVTSISVKKAMLPLRTYGAYQAALQANQEYLTRMSQAKTDAQKRLNETVGEAYQALVGTPWDPAAQPEQPGDFNLIGQYTAVRDEPGRRAPAAAGGPRPGRLGGRSRRREGRCRRAATVRSAAFAHRRRPLRATRSAGRSMRSWPAPVAMLTAS